MVNFGQNLVNVIKKGPFAVGAKALFLHQCHRAFLASACPAPSLYVFGKRDVLSIEKPTFTEVRRQFFLLEIQITLLFKQALSIIFASQQS